MYGQVAFVLSLNFWVVYGWSLGLASRWQNVFVLTGKNKRYQLGSKVEIDNVAEEFYCCQHFDRNYSYSNNVTPIL
ncbi:hypothetical protein MANES_02G033550v8 [Manihot esculenta]|uniref:Uncharacterized protein n=1 Tax=Manihot esculenta TaxID=3983 RepID=A0ACB7I4Y2_MANES|nr:hypothetical protein MANES_02G033550v8 [Manihot esculenta]